MVHAAIRSTCDIHIRDITTKYLPVKDFRSTAIFASTVVDGQCISETNMARSLDLAMCQSGLNVLSEQTTQRDGTCRSSAECLPERLPWSRHR